VLSRLRTSRWLRAALLALVLAFCGYGLFTEWPQVRIALGRLEWYSVAGAALAAVAGSGCLMLAWRAVLADLGSRLPVPTAIRTMFVAQLAKYVPGAVWAFAAQVELCHDHQVPRRRGATAVIVALALALAVGLLIAAATLPWTSGAETRYLWWAMALIPVILIGLWPPILGRILDRALILARMQPLERRPSARGLAIALGWTTLGWLFMGLQLWLLVRDVTGRGADVLLLALGANALAWAAGVLIVVFPGGIGPRELVLVATLAPVMPRGVALATALVSRVVLTASDLAWGGAGLAVGRARALSALPPSAQPQSAQPPSAQPRSQTPAGTRHGRHAKKKVKPRSARTGTPLSADAEVVEPTASSPS
jgi:glycosyltransferase 2 family protein